MTTHEKAAYMIMKREYNDYIGGLENTLIDYSPDDIEYIEAKEELSDADELVNTIYRFTIMEAERLRFAKHIKFAGADFIKNAITKLLIKDGYKKSCEV